MTIREYIPEPEELNVLDIEGDPFVKGAPACPRPVGCAVHFADGRPDHYYAWGHPDGNNCTKEEFREVLLSIWDKPVLGHNSDGFDLQDLEHHFGLPPRNTALNFDTLFAAFLYDPRAKSLALKDLANNYLGIPPVEQQLLYDWIMENVEDCRSRKDCGKYIALAPVELVSPYAIGDVSRPVELWRFFLPAVRRMWAAFDRERRLAPVLARANRRGVRVDMEGLERARAQSIQARDKLTQLIYEHLELPPESFNLDSNEELGQVLLAKGYTGFLLTPKARKPSMAKESLEAAIKSSDPELFAMLQCRSRYDKLLNGFILPWKAFAEANGGRLHPQYNQVRTPSDEDGNSYGARTGRLSCQNPNFQQVAKPKKGEKGIDYFGNPYPNLRALLLPEEGHVWFCADFKCQEPRITAHFEDGQLMAAFINDPEMDPYIYIQTMCGLAELEDGRDRSKVIFLGLVYAMGIAKLAINLDITEGEAKALRATIKRSLSGVVELDNQCKDIFKMGGELKTLGGRYYGVERTDDGRDWSYKALNTLVQGSAGDQTKETIVYVDDAAPDEILFLGTVHDEVSYSIPRELAPLLAKLLHEGANSIPCDVPMLLDWNIGNNWAEAKP